MSEEKLMFGIGYDTSTAEKDAIKEVNATLKNIQSLLDKKPLKPTMTIPNSFRGQLASLTSEWNRLTAAERSSAKGQEIIGKYRQLNKEVGIYSGTLRQAVNAEDKLQLSKEKGITLTKTQNSAYKTQLSYLDRLLLRWSARALLLGSVRVLDNIRETTAEFELQRVALGAIIQDADRASKLFNQIKAAAIESPFQIKDLVRYTKELSAYRIETDQLFETTQRLADISAGLGVDMSRLVLAYGQVRAASVLRGQELRQFTEAGIPLVQLLADKFSKLRGELVSTGEVFQLISERAVSFGMVKEIFDDMTNAGGMFNDMQRIQAKTLAGEWSNFKDAISIAYDEMGRELPLGEMVSSVKGLINNWRTVAQVVGTSVVALTAYSTAMKVVRFANDGAARSALALGRANILVTAAEKKKGATIANNSALLARAVATQDRYTIAVTKSAVAAGTFKGVLYKLKAAFLGNWIGLVVAALATLVTWIINATKNANRLNKELREIETKANIDFSQSTRNFKRLAENALNAADGSKKQTEALQELQRTYGDIVPAQNLTIEGLRNMKGNYDAVTQSIYEKIQAQKVEAGLTSIQEDYTPKIKKAEEKFETAIKDIKEFADFSDNDIARIKAAYVQAINEGEINASMSEIEQFERIIDIIKENVSGVFPEKLQRRIDWYVGLWKRANKEVAEGGAISASTQAAFIAEKQLTSLSGSVLGLTRTYADLNNAEQKLIQGNSAYSDSINKLNEDVTKAVKDMSRTGFATEFDFDKAVTAKKIDEYKKFIGKQLSKKGINVNVDDFISDYYKGTGVAISGQLKKDIDYALKQIGDLTLTPQQQLYSNIFEQVAEQTGASMDKLKQYMLGGEQSTADWVKSLTGSLESAKEKVTELKRDMSLYQTSSAKGVNKFVTDEDVRNAEGLVRALELLVKYFGTPSVDSDRSKSIQTEIKLVEEVYKKYKDYLNYMSSAEAQDAIKKIYGGTKADGFTYGIAFDTKSLQAILQRYKAELERLGKKDEAIKVGKLIDDFSFNELKDDLTKELARLSDEISRSKTAKTFFDKMLGITGDRELALSMTMSVYGDVGSNLADSIKGQLRTAFGEVDIEKYLQGDKIDYVGLDKLLKSLNPEELKKIREEAKKLVEQGIDSYAKEVETLYSSLTKFEDYADKRLKILREYQNKVNEINKMTDDAERTRLTELAQKLRDTALQNLGFDAFKESGLYVAMFDDLDKKSTQTLQRMRDYLEQLRPEWENLAPEQLKQMQSRFNEIDKMLNSRNPFKTLAKSIREYSKEARKMSQVDRDSRLIQSVKQEDLLKKRLDIQTKIVEKAEVEYELASKDPSRVAELSALRLRLALEKTSLQNIKESYQKQKQTTDEMQEQADILPEIIAKMSDAISAVTQFSSAISSAARDVGDMLSEIADSSAAQQFFKDMAEGVGSFAEGAADLAMGIIKTDAGDLTGIANIIKGMPKLAKGIYRLFSATKIKKSNEALEAQQKAIDNLSYAYSRLEKASEDALGVDWIRNYQSKLQNLEARAIAYEKKAQEERSKGWLANKEKVKDYLDSAREARNEIVDMYGSLSEYMLDTSLTSAAKEFASAWLEAKLSFASTADAMSGKFEDMLQNMVVNSVMARVVQQRLKKVFEMVEELGEDGDYSAQDIAIIAQETKIAATDINKGLGVIYASIRGAVSGITTSNLTGIAKNIAGASEESITGLAAGINTQNFYIANVNSNVAVIRSLLEGGLSIGSQDLVTMQNTYLSNLPSIKADTAGIWQEIKLLRAGQLRIADNLDRVIKPRGVQGSHTVNTSL